MLKILTETRECHVYCYNKCHVLYLEDFAADLGIKEELLSLKMKLGVQRKQPLQERK